MPAIAVCRAGLALTTTGILAILGGTPQAWALLGGGLALLAYGGWTSTRKG